MAKIWPAYDGKNPTSGECWAELSLSDAVELFELTPGQFVSDLTVTPRFGDMKRDLTWAGFKQVLVEVERGEATKSKWKSGFYASRIKPKEGFRRLIQHAVATELGSRNVVRVECVPTVDSLGQDALTVTVVLTPGAPGRIADEAVVNASVKLRDRLLEMSDYSTPIIEYATEAELAEDAGS